MTKIVSLILCALCAIANAASLPEAVDLFQSKQYDKALPIFQEYANKGILKAQSYLARMYVNGLGTKQNYDEALFWASKAAAKNDSVSQGVLGYLYLNGYGGLVKDNVKAMTYYRKAADQDSPIAIDRYSQIVLQRHTKKGLDEIEAALIRDKSMSSSLVLMKLYGNGKYKPSNLQKSIPFALESIRRGASSPIWYIIDNSKFLQLTDVLNAAWLKALYDLKNPELVDFPNYQSDLKAAIESLKPEEIQEVERIKLPELISKTEKFLKERQKKYGSIEAVDFVDEGWVQFVGERGVVNEPLAQLLMEEGLKKAIAMRNQDLINHARNNLGVLFGAAVNSNVRNKRLAQVHIIDGADSEYGPDNLIWYAYEGKIDLPEDQFKALLKRYKDLDKKDHILEALGPLPPNLKNKPFQIIQYLTKKYEESPNDQIAEQIADMYEDNYTDSAHLMEAKKWYEIREKLQGEDADSRLHRMNKILAGNYVKDMPDMRNSIDELFELRTSSPPNLIALTPSTIKEDKVSTGSRKPALYALVIGNSQYQSGRLGNALNDASLMATKLRSFGFNVTYAPDLNRKSFMSALMNFSEKARDADVTVFYYSGHGMQLGGVNYLLPTDMDFRSKEDIVAIDGVSLNDIIRRNLPGKSKIIFLDACRTKPFKSSAATFANHGLAPMNVPRGTLISFATKDGGVAFDGPEGKNSPYTGALATLIGEKEDIAILLRNVRDDVLKATQGKQEPWEYGSLSGGKLVLSNISSQ
ncbi:caspase family protein [Polynucleobacter sp. MWH-HuK1]|uniref:caspase family protein n=1 Tax=Polynucleobacter sp. MWH-HuK1 TaxID=1743158 RepID=UPI001C0D5356|nr:caspase family protein [Polynucleobacter sp. MWH-HuK1]MBU3566375.1 caspase family protein [Polynucleobacter sp. MWH-HuK1]